MARPKPRNAVRLDRVEIGERCPVCGAVRGPCFRILKSGIRKDLKANHKGRK
jgi:hypothetical protein